MLVLSQDPRPLVGTAPSDVGYIMAAEVSCESSPSRGTPRGLRNALVLVCLVLLAPNFAATEIRAGRHVPAAAVLARWSLAESMLDAGDHAAAELCYTDLLSDAAAELAAAEGLALLREATCAGDTSLIAAGARIVAAGGETGVPDDPARYRAAARRAHHAAARWRRSGHFHRAAADFADASRCACAANDTFAGFLFARAAVTCAVYAGQPALGSAWLASADSLLVILGGGVDDPASDREFRAVHDACERLRLDLQLARAGLASAAGEHARADSLFDDLAAVAAHRGWERLRCDAMLGLAAIHSRRRQTESATAYSRDALNLARELRDRHRQTRALVRLGYDEAQRDDLDAAEAALEDALSLVDACGSGHHRAFVQAGLAAVAEARGDRAQAVAGFREAWATHARLGNETGELGARQRLAYNLLILGHYGEAISQYERCLEILARQDSLVMRNWVLGGLALAYHRLGRLDLAADHYRRSLAVDRRLGDRASEAWALRSLGILFTMRGDCRQALVHIESARVLSDSLGNAREVGDAHAAIAYVHLSLGDFARSREHFEKALALADSMRYDELRRNAASGLTNLCREADRPDEARRYANRALAMARRWHDRSAILESLSDLAELHLEADHRDSALVALAECRRLLDDGGALLLGARIALLEARAAPTHEIARARAEDALALAVKSGLPEREWMALTALADAHAALGDTTAALGDLERALSVVESLRRAVGSDDLRRQMLRAPLAPYERLIALLVAAGREGDPALQALAVTERSRAQLLADRLRDKRALQGEGRPPRPATMECEQERELLARLAYLQTRLQDGALPPEQRREILKEALERENEIRLLRLQREGPQAANSPDALSGVVEPSTLLGALETDEVAISYYLGAEASYAFRVSRSGVVVHLLPARQDLEERVRRFLRLRATVTGGSTEHPLADAVARAGRELFSLLLAPSVAGIGNVAPLIIIPDGLLHHLPFAALHDEHGAVLGRHALSLAPSLRTLGFLRQRERSRHLAPPPRFPLIAIGSEGGGAPTGRSERLLPFDGRALAYLPSAAAEARQVASLFPGSILLVGAGATERSVTTSPLHDAAVLHFAAHGHADPRLVTRSFLVLNLPAAGPPSPAEADATSPADAEDGLLQWEEIAALPLRARLITLSACRSAGGALAGGEGIIGLTQAFLQAGASCVLATSGDVRDDRVLPFVMAFYEHWRRGLTAQAALRAVHELARQAASVDEQTAAEFVLVGDGSVRIAMPPPAGRSSAHARWLLCLAAAGAAAAAFAWFRRARIPPR